METYLGVLCFGARRSGIYEKFNSGFYVSDDFPDERLDRRRANFRH